MAISFLTVLLMYGTLSLTVLAREHVVSKENVFCSEYTLAHTVDRKSLKWMAMFKQKPGHQYKPEAEVTGPI